MDLLLYPGIFVVALLTGYLLKTGKIKSYRKKINHLEQEMLRNHAEILKLQKEKIELLKQLETPSIPVISIKSAKEERTAAVADAAGTKR